VPVSQLGLYTSCGPKLCQSLLPQWEGSALEASEATLEELRNVHLRHWETSVPLSRFGNLRVLTLCRVYGPRNDSSMGVLRQLPTSLEVRKSLLSVMPK